jgi:hypothetical protein
VNGDRRALAMSGALFVLLIVLVCLRSWVPVRTYAHFDSDQAVFGLMARDLAAGRGFPLFMYGQRYLLAVSVWLCAPLFALFGASITTLKLPMFLMNIAVVAMLWRGLRREPGLGPWGTALAILPFAIPSAVISSRLVEHQGGNIEPFVFVLAAFFLRQRPIALGILLGVAFLNREFSLIAWIALVLMDAAQGTLEPFSHPRGVKQPEPLRESWQYRRSRGYAEVRTALVRKIRAHITTAMSFASVVIAVRVLAHWSTSYGGSGPLWLRPGWTKLADFFTQQMPTLVGGGSRRLSDFNIVSSLTVGHGVVYVAVIAWLIVLVATCWRWQPLERAELDGMSAYLVLVGAGQAAAFIALSPYPGDRMVVRYLLVSLLGLCGLVAFAWRRPALRGVTAGVMLLMTAFNLAGNVRLVREYASGPPRRELNELAEALEQRGVRYLEADYWTAFDVAWVSGERVIASPQRGSGNRMVRYSDALDAHRGEVFTITDRARPGCEAIVRWHLCPPPQSVK